MAAIKTAPAAISLINLILESFSVAYKSHTFSIAEFSASKESTSAEIDRIISHSETDMEK